MFRLRNTYLLKTIFLLYKMYQINFLIHMLTNSFNFNFEDVWFMYYKNLYHMVST